MLREPSHGREVELGGEQEGDADHLEASAAKAGQLVVLEASPVVDRSGGQCG